MKEHLKKKIDKLWKHSDKLLVDEIFFESKKPFEKDVLNFKEREINEAYRSDNQKYPHVSFIRKFEGNIFIEPDYAYGLFGNNNIINSSVFYKALTPSLPRYINSRLNQSNALELGEVIIFDGQVGKNYFHFFIDVMNKLWMLDKIPNSKNIPLLINEATFNTQYFQYLYKKNETLKSLNWVVQKKNNYVKTKKLYVIQCERYNGEFIKRTKSMFIEGLKVKEPFRKVFLNRSIKTGRTISNFHEIKPILEKYNFEIIENEKLTTQEQIELYQSVQILVSIHGAGNTNIIFANENLKFLEINPKNRISTHYYWLAKALGINKYDCILGDALPFTNVYPEASFYLDPVKFDERIASLLID